MSPWVRENPMMVLGGALLFIVTVVAIFAPLIAPFDPYQQSLASRLLPPGSAGANGYHLLGTDQLGRDVLSRTIYGTRISLAIAWTSVLIAGVFGALLGLVAGFRGGIVDELIMGLADTIIAFPTVLLAVVAVAALGGGLPALTIALILSNWVVYTRMMRGQVMTVKGQDFVVGAHAIGATWPRVMFRYILPVSLPPVAVVATVQMGAIIVLESGLSFLGLGVPPSVPSWGSMLADAQDFLGIAWWLSVVPGLAITLTVMAINFLGDGLLRRMGGAS
jgi:peptide/nickel transport system permease protein